MKKNIDSRYLAYLLRHHPEEANLHLDKNGWCDVDELLSALDLYQDELDDIVYSNTRFVYNENKTKIKAAHGHSVKVSYQNAAVPPNVLYHGTSRDLIPAIRRGGLKKMNRDAVHLSERYDTAVAVGARHTGGRGDRLVIYKVKAFEMHLAGYKFYKSEDGVWLTDSVPPEYLYI